MFSALFWFLIGSLLVIVIMIGGSEKRNCEGGFELQPPLVFEKRSNPQKREFSLLLNTPRSRYSVLGYNWTITPTNINVSLNIGAREREVKLRQVVYELWSVSYLCFSFQIWYFWNWIITSIGQSKHMRVARFNSLWVSGVDIFRRKLMLITLKTSRVQTKTCLLWCRSE